jgi:hypothetical protein
MSDAAAPSSGTPAPSRLRPLLFTALAVALGAAIGGLYAHFIGCRTGTCPITSSVRNASLYGAFVGMVIGWPARGRDRDGSARQPQRPHPPPEGAAAPPQR